MGENTGIQWTNRTWNPWRGCDKVSPGCAHCYMFSEQTRYGKDPAVVTRTKTWGDPIKWQRQAEREGRTGELVFTCSWSDWFHEAADAWRDEAWQIVKACDRLTFQILTKRTDRILACLPNDWLGGYPNVWLGTSVENQRMADLRIPELFGIAAAVRFLSLEPLLGSVNLHAHLCVNGDVHKPEQKVSRMICASNGLLHWAIIGGESGPGARPFALPWAYELVEQFSVLGVATFVKQLGSRPFNRVVYGPMAWTGDEQVHEEPLKLRDRKGGDIAEWPDDLRVREFPPYGSREGASGE